MIPGFMLYMEDLMAFTDQMSAEEMGLVMFALVHYIATGEEPDDLEGLPLTCYRILRNKVGRDQSRYQEMAERGARGGRPRKAEKAQLSEKKPMVSDEKPMVLDEKAQLSEKNLTVSVPVTVPVSETVPVSVSVSETVSERQAGKVPPSLEDVRRYAETTKTTIDPERFFSYYQSRGWELSPGMPMRNWQAVFNIWIQNEAEKGQAKKKTITAQQFPQRNYSNDTMNSFYTDLSAYAPAEDD